MPKGLDDQTKGRASPQRSPHPMAPATKPSRHSITQPALRTPHSLNHSKPNRIAPICAQSHTSNQKRMYRHQKKLRHAHSNDNPTFFAVSANFAAADKVPSLSHTTTVGHSRSARAASACLLIWVARCVRSSASICVYPRLNAPRAAPAEVRRARVSRCGRIGDRR
jgi:hypothetical protein